MNLKKSYQMKMFKKMWLVILVATVFSACGGGGGDMSPEDVTKAFMKEMIDYDFEGAKAYATESSAAALSMMAGFAEQMKDELPEMPKEFEVSEATIDGDKATVTVSQEGSGEEKMTLVNDDGAWKIDLGMAGMAPGGDADMGGDTDMGGGEEDIDMDAALEEAMQELDAALEELETESSEE